MANFLLRILLLPIALAATSVQWRDRKIYQLLTDRFAPFTPNAPCNPADIKYCGGTWSTIEQRLDYIQGLGFDAVWISPTSKQIQTSIYGQAYHGYWPIDHTQLNEHFGDAKSLQSLSDALHKRGMYLMVDVVLNHFASLSTDISTKQLQSNQSGHLQFTDQANYHPPCEIDYSNETSVLDCWFSTVGYALMDVATETAVVQQRTNAWLKKFVTDYQVDGLRLDLAKDVDDVFLRGACAAAGVFCIGEVGTSDANYAARYQVDKVLDSVLSYPMWYGFVNSFSAELDMNVIAYNMWQTQAAFTDTSVLGTFIENHDQARFNSLTKDKSLVYNALVGSYMFEGIPIVYYGFEFDDNAGNDPYNRAALWLKTNYTTPTTPTSTSQRIIKLNKLRKYLGAQFYTSTSTRQNTKTELAMIRGQTVTVLSSRGANSSGTLVVTATPFTAGQAVVDVLSCKTAVVASNKSLTVSITSGLPSIWIATANAKAGGFC